MMGWMQRYIAAWNSHDATQVGAFMEDDAIYEDLALGQVHAGRTAIEAFVATAHEFSNDYVFTTISEQGGVGRYAIEWELAGTNSGEAAGLPATHKPFRIRGVSVGRLGATGRIVENRDYWNMADFLTQVGILPAPGG
jgi:steroid delta-isomerase-like uncharacterized protein